ncbi:SPOR domain-containing protein [Paracoccus laeviglucosivorans]|uniref:Cell division protein DamX, binds to the septal ring, contains C-terminal SPOR domain n=1 Tax=Paracoccus laeviglucosivorans TaxID=1197861 RepID=A0A521D454_9RHOB|nr:SPOR domain-containing protein [Paracoccus laeviglucosivorans]SMO66464.1 Cell division protein DamX, binds to the septal ring, contains C-terminal SPOR domain [Paracoccus laeviglucosivorans]
MAVVDFRSGGFQGTHPQDRHAHGYGHDAYADEYDDARDESWDDPRYDDPYGQATAEPPSMLGRLSRLTHYLGALVSVGLIVVLAVWGFKLVVRDVSGVPVIRAVQGEARTAPENPGGELTDRTGLAVNSVAAGTEAQRVDQVAIAPGATGLQAQDVAMGVLGATAIEPSRAVELPPLDETARVIATPDADAARAAAEAAQSTIEPDSVEAAIIADVPTAPEAPVNEALTDLSGQQTQDTAINQALAEATAEPGPPPAVAASVRPAPRPRRVAAASAVAPAPAVAETAPADRPAAAPADAAPEAAPAAKVSAGSSMAQIGAFDSDKLARGEWNRVSGKFGGLFAGKNMIVQEHSANGRKFWRLRAAGFASKDEARRFCAALIAEGVDCIPATAK